MASDWGADVGKDVVVVARHGEGSTVEMANTEATLRAWVKRLEAGSRIGVEASGVHHRCLARVAIAAGHTVYVLNPRDMKHYANGVGRRAKTDRVDARVIARYVAHEHEHLRVYREPDARQLAIAELLEKRHAVVKAKVSLTQALPDTGSCAPLWKRCCARSTPSSKRSSGNRRGCKPCASGCAACRGSVPCSAPAWATCSCSTASTAAMP